jgi:hypothetical protein
MYVCNTPCHDTRRTIVQHRPPLRSLGVYPAFLLALGACAGHPTPGATPAGTGDAATVRQSASSATVARSAAARAGVVPPDNSALPAGVVFDARLNQSLTGETPVGYAFSTNLTAPIDTKDGAAVIPAGTTVRGVVTGVADGPIIRLNIDFLEMPGRSLLMRGSVAAIQPPAPVAAPALLPAAETAKLFPAREGAGGVAFALPKDASGTATLPAGTILSIRIDSTLALR